MIKSGILYNIEILFYIQAKGIIALSTDISAYIKVIVPNKPIEVISNISDCDFFKLKIKNRNIKATYGISNELVISYTGILGKANHLEYLIDIAKSTEHLNILFLIVGDGAEKSKLEFIVKYQKLQNIKFIASTNKKGIKSILNISDAIYVSFRNIEILHTGSPNKLFDGLAAGKMIISNLSGWTKKLIEKEQVGICYHSEKPQGFVKKIILYINNKFKLSEVKSNSRKLAEKEYSLDMLSQKQLRFINKFFLCHFCVGRDLLNLDVWQDSNFI